MRKSCFKDYILKICIISLCCLLILGILFLSQTFNQSQISAYAEDDTENVYSKIDTYLSETIKKTHFPALSITIVNKNDILFQKAYGDCQSTDTPFLLGSVSKSFTALCIMQLVESGKINLDEKISTYLPEIKEGNKITVRQLLNHTSGLSEHQNLGNIKIVGKQGEHVYANVNYSILGCIIESVSGLTYEEYVSQNIFQPLSMSKSAISYEKATENGLIDSYENWFGVNTQTKPKYPISENAWITPSAGYISSSTNDLGKYLQMYLNDGQGIISKDSINKMFYENVSVNADIPYQYGMGWTLIKDPLPQNVLRHAGLVETGMATIYIIPEMKIGFAVTVNTNDYFVGKDFMDRLDWGIALMLMGEKPNEIGSNEYVSRHLLYDFAYFIVLAFAFIPLCLIRLYKKNINKGKMWLKISLTALLHIIIPLFLILLPRIFFATPLWVVQAFVPDMFFVIIISSCLLFIGGIIKSIILFSSKFKKVVE